MQKLYKPPRSKTLVTPPGIDSVIPPPPTHNRTEAIATISRYTIRTTRELKRVTGYRGGCKIRWYSLRKGHRVIKAGLDSLVGVVDTISEYWVLGVDKWIFTRSVRSNTDEQTARRRRWRNLRWNVEEMAAEGQKFETTYEIIQKSWGVSSIESFLSDLFFEN